MAAGPSRAPHPAHPDPAPIPAPAPLPPPIPLPLPPHIDRLHARALERLRAHRKLPAVLTHVLDLATGPERARFVRELLRHHRLLPLEPPPGPAKAKRAEQSAEHRAAGNRLYSTRRNLQALVCYNRAIAAAPPGSSELRLALGNRSAALLALGRRQDCLDDVARALQAGPDAALREKLVQRRVACLQLPPEPPPEPRVAAARERLFSLPGPRHHQLPCASAGLALRHDAEAGRRVIALADFKPGDVLAVEEPYMALLLPPYVFLHCYYCCAKCYTPVPCHTCSSVVYCGDECRTVAWRRFHEHECKIIHYTDTMGFSKLELLSLRAVLLARSDHDSWSSLRKTVAEIDAEPDPLRRGFVEKNGKRVYDSANYASIHALETNLSKRGGADIFQKSFATAVMLDLLAEFTDFFQDETDPDGENVWFAGGLLLHHIMTATCNMHTIDGLAEDAKHTFRRTYDFASGAYPFMSLLNHSCNPNVIRQNVGTTSVLLCLRPIPRGAEVLDCYGPHFALQNLMERLETVSQQYKFHCSCEACVHNWPTYQEMQSITEKCGPRTPDVVDKLTTDTFTRLQMGDMIAAVETMDAMYGYVNILENFIPCKELADYQETIKQCWGVLGNMYYLDK